MGRVAEKGEASPVGYSFNGLHLNPQLVKLENASKKFGEIITNNSEKTKSLQLFIPVPSKYCPHSPETRSTRCESGGDIKTYIPSGDSRLYPPTTRDIASGSSCSDLFNLLVERHFVLLQSL